MVPCNHLYINDQCYGISMLQTCIIIIIVHINEKMTHYHTVNLHIKNVFQIGKYNTDSKKSLVLLHT